MQEVKVCSEVGLLENGELIGQSQKKKEKRSQNTYIEINFILIPFSLNNYVG